ncbi:MAG: hypothetical protein L3K02_03110 [Thermoplasmata archaeon]|nr:hypothetical protein [Thermoplasmata archaeon]
MSFLALGRRVPRFSRVPWGICVAIVVLLLGAVVLPLASGTNFGFIAPSAGSPSAPSHSTSLTAPGSAGAQSSIAPPTGNPPAASGPGVFFVNHAVPAPPTNNSTCNYLYWSQSCLNNTGGPSIVSTPAGVMAAAYTAFTNATVCPADNNLTYSEIGITTSTNGGGNWSAPSYIGNPDCSQAFNYTSAMTPSITALGNGTLVLAYIEYNATTVSSNNNCQAWDWFPSLGPCEVYYARLVVTLSYDNGTNWTMPVAVNSSSNTGLNASFAMPAQPSIAAVGQTVYLAWTNETLPYFDTNTPPSIGLNMVVSTDGAQTWGPPVQLPVESGPFYGSTSYVAYAPAVLVGTSGTVFVTYSTHFQENTTAACIPAGCAGFYPSETMDVVLARSVNNGSSWTVSTVGANVWVDWNGGGSWTFGGPGTQVSPEPAIAQDSTTGELFVTWSGSEVGLICFSVGNCYVESEFMNVFVAHSTNGGSTWSTPLAIGDSVLQRDAGARSGEYLFLPSIGVGSGGTVYVSVQYTNESACLPLGACGLQTDIVFESTDHGVSFPGIFYPYSIGQYVGYPLWDGFSTSMTIYNGTPYMAWTQEIAPPPGFFSGGTSQVVISSPFEGTGVTVNFTESGLPAGSTWGVDLSGNLRSGLAATTLSVSGVPTGQNVSWAVPWVNVSYGRAFASLTAPASPGAFSANTTIASSYSEYVLLNILTVPPAQSVYPFWCGGTSAFFGDYCGNQQVAPTPGGHWVPVNTSVPWSVTNTGFPSNCYYCYNYTFLAWTGSGNGSWNTTFPNGSSVIAGPVNETASFSVSSSCTFGTCTNLSYTYSFQEIGLPLGTAWTVTLGGLTLTSITSAIAFSDGAGPYAFTVWTVPFNATESWVGSPSYPSPITSLQGATETVRFLLLNDTSIPSEVTFGASGLPAGVNSWGLTVNGTTYGIPSTNATLDLGSGSFPLNATPVYGPDQVGGYLTGFRIAPEAQGASSFTVLPGAVVNFSGPAVVTALYAPEYWVTVTSTSGGSTNPSSVGWIPSGGAVVLNAVAQAGFAFIGWSGSGPGSSSATTNAISINPVGPVTELASFVAIVPTYQVSVTATGLLAGIPLTLTLGNQTYSEVAPFVVTGLLPGAYSLALPTVYPNGTFGVRYDASSVSSSLTLSGGSLHVTANGTLSLGYTASYAVTVAPAVNGTTSPSAGTYWEVRGTPVMLVATPLPGHSFAGWFGLGASSVSGTNASLSVTPTGPITETAYFTTNPIIPPATFSVTLTEVGLPTGATWSAAVSSNGVSGTGSLVLTGLNGTYTVVVPIVAGSSGVRYAPSSNGSFSVGVDQNRNLQVNFTTQYSVSVSTSSGGTATPSTGWVDAGASVSLSAAASATYTFENWSGTGSGSYTGTSPTASVTVTSPVTELATFVPASSLVSPKSTSGGASAWLLPIGLLVVLLIVGLVVGLLIGRSRPPSGGSSTEAGPAETDAPSAPTWQESSETTETPSTPPTSGSGGDSESIYGGGPG